MIRSSLNLNTVRAGARKIPGRIIELDNDFVTSEAPAILKQASKIGESLLLKIDTINDAKKVLKASLEMQALVMYDIKHDYWMVKMLLSPLFHEDAESLDFNDLKALKREVILFCFRRELEAKKFLNKAAAPAKEHFIFQVKTYIPPTRQKGRYLIASMPCPLKLSYHVRPQGDVFFYGRLFEDYPIYMLRYALDEGKNMALEISKDEYDGILDAIYEGQLMTFYSVKTDQMARMVLKGLLNLIRLTNLYECDNAGTVNKRPIGNELRFY